MRPEGFEEAVQPLMLTEGRISGVNCMAREYENGRVYFLVNEQDGSGRCAAASAKAERR